MENLLWEKLQYSIFPQNLFVLILQTFGPKPSVFVNGVFFFFPMSFERFCCSYYCCCVLLGGSGARAVFASDLLKLCCGEGVPACFFFFFFVTSYMVGQKDKRTNNRTMPLCPKGSSENRAFVCEVQVRPGATASSKGGLIGLDSGEIRLPHIKLIGLF